MKTLLALVSVSRLAACVVAWVATGGLQSYTPVIGPIPVIGSPTASRHGLGISLCL